MTLSDGTIADYREVQRGAKNIVEHVSIPSKGIAEITNTNLFKVVVHVDRYRFKCNRHFKDPRII